MGFRAFTDRQGRRWEVRNRVKSEWEISPLGDNPERPRMVPAPGYESDPFEMSEEELQRLLDTPDPGKRTRAPRSPFGD